MGNVTSWIARCIYPEEQVLWQAARNGDALGLRAALAKLTPETRKHIEWQEPCSGRTALAEAALRGYRACAAALIEYGANCNVKDYRGNTPLHLACKKGRDDVVQSLLQTPSVFPFETNLESLTPLDVVRRKIKDDDAYPLAFERCLEELEKKFCIYSGWVYEEHDNVLSMVSGISSLSSWKRRFCIVLERGAPDILELALFSMKPGGARPVCPKSVVLYQVGAGMSDTTDSKWFNRKDLVFTIRGTRQEKRQYDATIEMEPLAFAAVDQQSYDAWKSFFTQQQQSLHARASVLYGQPTVMLAPHHPVAMALPLAAEPQVPHDWREAKPPTAAATTTFVPHMPPTSSAQTQEDEELRRAIWLSLQTARGAPDDSAFEAAPSPPLPVSAPDWDDDEDDDSDGIVHGGSEDDGVGDSHATAEALPPAAAAAAPADAPIVDFARAPSFTGIGECVICFDGPQAAVCVPCGHNAICMTCAEEILETSCECPVCRRPIRELIKLYRV